MGSSFEQNFLNSELQLLEYFEWKKIKIPESKMLALIEFCKNYVNIIHFHFLWTLFL